MSVGRPVTHGKIHPQLVKYDHPLPPMNGRLSTIDHIYLIFRDPSSCRNLESDRRTMLRYYLEASQLIVPSLVFRFHEQPSMFMLIHRISWPLFGWDR